METVLKVTQAGVFYPSEKDELSVMIDALTPDEVPPYKSKAIIVPHAGYVYSGDLIARGYSVLDSEAETVFVFAPSHYVRLYGCVIPSADAIETPLGKIFLNKKIIDELHQNFGLEYSSEAFSREHAVETQLPFIQKFLPNASVVPIIYGCENYENISKIIARYDNGANAFVISSDLSHFYPARENIRTDTFTASLIESNETANFEADNACGAVGICALMNYAKEKGMSLIRLGLSNSAKVTGDTSSVVGYGSWFMFDGEKNEFIKKYYSKSVIELCRKAISAGLHKSSFIPQNYPGVLEESGACFVTLTAGGRLRGCIGSVIAHRPLIVDLIKNAYSAAFSDPRFNPLSPDEFYGVDVEVSLLSYPEKLQFNSEEELMAQIVPRRDGIIIRDGNHQGVFLPCVWEQLPDKTEFMQALKQKAGLDKSYFSETFTVFRFSAVELV